MTYHYKYLADNSHERSFKSTRDPEFAQYVAEEAAQDYHFRLGWEYNEFPEKFTLLLADGTLLGVFEVERRLEPAFYATEIK